MIAALYLRSATADDESIAERNRLCTEHATAQGWRVGEIFTDNVVSGVRDDRPGLAGLRDCLCEGRASVVIAADDVRFSRDLEKLAEFISWCEAQGAKISCVKPIGVMFFPTEPLFSAGNAKRRRRAAGRTSI